MRLFKPEQIVGILLKHSPFSSGGRFDDQEIAVEGKRAEHYSANQPQYVDTVVLPRAYGVRQEWIRNENRAILFVIAGEDDKMAHGFAADIIKDEIVAFGVFSGGIVEIGGAQA